ncbi:TonB-dependent receptor [Salinibacter grassmerensis]|uniref:TonB-dependent receptor n=1 Tax=Salinibacter grassmerensis TaxID=3040353 RepID=UPI0021E82D14|nr:TonB-dependent receptor [Salinibacter grassmerensis]
MTLRNTPTLSPQVRSALWTACLFLLLAGLTAPKSHGQAALEVHAFDVGANESVSGAAVHLVNEGIGFEATRRTDDQGTTQWGGLSTAGTYSVFIEENDQFYEARVSGIELRANATRSVTLVLRPVAEYALDEVVVEGGRSVAEVNRVNGEVSSSLDAAALEDLPVEGRNFTQSLYRLPNVTPSTGFFAEAPNVSINGANGLYTNYLIDGMDNNEQFLGGPQFDVPTGVVKDVTVLTSTYSAEYGRTGNGIFNVTTKSGSNEYEGEAFYLTRPGQPLDGEFGEDTPTQRDLSGNTVKSGFQRQQGGFALGGPIVADQTFFHVSLEHTTDFKDNLLDAPGVRETIDGRNQLTYASARVDHRWNDQWRSTARLNANRVHLDNQGGRLTGGVRFASAANTEERDGVHAALQNTYTGDQLVYESNFQYSWFNWDAGNPSNPNSPRVTVQDTSGLTIAALGHPGFQFDSVENTFQTQQKLTYQLGSHTLRAGLDVLTSGHRLAGGGNPNGNYAVRLDSAQTEAFADARLSPSLTPSELPGALGVNRQALNVTSYTVEQRPSTFGRRQNLIGVYVEDQFTPLPNLTVTTGLRYDYDSLTEGGGGADEADYNNLAPRLSFNYALDERTTLRGGYGIFYDKIVYAVTSDALESNSNDPAFQNEVRTLVEEGILPGDTDIDEVTFNGTRSAQRDSAGYLQRPSDVTPLGGGRRILNPNGYENPQTHQFSLGVQRQFGNEWLAYVDLIHTRSYDLFRIRELNAPEAYDISATELAAARQDPNRDPADLVRSPAAADATRPIPSGRSITMTETEGEARYWAANFNLVKDRGDDWYSGRLSYTLSRLRNNTDDINFRAETGNQYEAEWGPSVNDRRHVISAIGTAYPTDRLRVTLASLIQSGQPVNWVPDASIFGTRDLNGDGREYGAQYVGNSDRWPGAERNSGRLPWSYRLDLSAQYAWPVADGRVVARADVFNVLNTKNLSGYANNATQSNQIQVGPPGSDIEEKNAGPPRQFQFGLRYEF